MTRNIISLTEDNHSDSTNVFDPPPTITFDDIDGLDEQKTKLRRTIVAALDDGHPSCTHPVSALIYGPEDTGKSRLSRAIAGEAEAAFRHVSTIDALGAHTTQLYETLKTAEDHTPALIIADNAEDWMESDQSKLSDVIDILTEYRTTDTQVGFITVLEPRRGIHNRSLIGTMDTLIEIPMPDAARRAAVIQSSFDELIPVTEDITYDEDIDFAKIAGETEQFTLSQLRAVARRSILYGCGDLENETNSDPETITEETILDAISALTDEYESINHLTSIPNSLSENSSNLINRTSPDVSFDEIGGQAHAKRQLQEYIEYPKQYPEFFDDTALDRTRGILLYGPPGNGKTMLAKAVANETECAFFSVAGPELQNKYVGETEKRIRTLFEQARETAPAIIFFDEFDSIALDRTKDRIPPWKRDFVNTLLAELDGLEAQADVVVIAATNHRTAIDSAILRPGRLDRHIEVPVPDKAAYADILRVHTQGLPVEEDLDLEEIAAELPPGLSGAELANRCREAAYRAIRDSDVSTTPKIKQEHFNIDISF